MVAPLKTPFGTFQGKQGDGVTQYRGIKYGSVRDQLSAPDMVTEYSDAVVDAIHFGPRAPAIDGCDFEQSVLIQCSLQAPEETPPMSGTECLNLNITVPDIKVEIEKRLPVMVFVHGGGYIMGANYWPQYDLSLLVKMSVEMGVPVIGVNINYRLGLLGNLTSKELRDAGYMGNNSLRDQKCSLQWVKKHIEAFGGDGGNITVFGESAGAASVLYQLHSKEPLFKRCISMSGTPLMLKPLPLSVAEMAYTSIIKGFSLENSSVKERIDRLRTASPEALVSKTPMSVPLLPIFDGDILPTLSVPPLPSQDGIVVPEQITFATLLSKDHSSLPGMKWCSSLMIGDCQHDGTVFSFMGLSQRKPGIVSALTTSLSTNLPTAAVEAVLQAYNITSIANDDDAMRSVLQFATDIAYVAPSLTYARSFPGKSYYYHFNEPNPWDGAFKGCSTHMLDAAYLFQHFNEHLPFRAQVVAKAIGVDFVKFANGLEPWMEYDDEKGQIRTYGPGKVGVVEDKGWGDGRSDVLWKLSAEGKVDLDGLIGAWNMFVAGR